MHSFGATEAAEVTTPESVIFWFPRTKIITRSIYHFLHIDQDKSHSVVVCLLIDITSCNLSKMGSTRQCHSCHKGLCCRPLMWSCGNNMISTHKAIPAPLNTVSTKNSRGLFVFKKTFLSIFLSPDGRLRVMSQRGGVSVVKRTLSNREAKNVLLTVALMSPC